MTRLLITATLSLAPTSFARADVIWGPYTYPIGTGHSDIPRKDPGATEDTQIELDEQPPVAGPGTLAALRNRK
jgi:hypothetical protein